MKTLELNVHGVRVRVISEKTGAESVLEALLEDFRFFEAASDASEAHPEIEMILHLGSPPADLLRSGRPLFKTRMCAVHGLGRDRVCDYGDGMLVHGAASSHGRRFQVYARSREEIYEAAYVALLSAVGEELDRRGFHRVHALGITSVDRCGLVILPQGGGKSAMAALLSGRFRLFSDEIPLIRDGVLYPFPIRIALRPEVSAALGLDLTARRFARRIFPEKLLYPITSDQVAEPARCDFVVVGRLGADTPRIVTTASSLALAELLRSMTVGIGVPQMAEHMLRIDNSVGLLRIASSRSKEAVSLAWKADSFRFDVTRDARSNSQVLAEFLEQRTF